MRAAERPEAPDPTKAGAAKPPTSPSTALGAPKRNDNPPANRVTSAIPANAVSGPIR